MYRPSPGLKTSPRAPSAAAATPCTTIEQNRDSRKKEEKKHCTLFYSSGQRVGLLSSPALSAWGKKVKHTRTPVFGMSVVIDHYLRSWCVEPVGGDVSCANATPRGLC